MTNYVINSGEVAVRLPCAVCTGAGWKMCRLWSSFVLISIDQSSGMCLNSLVVYINDGSSALTELWHNDLSISNIVTSKSGDIFTVDITYDKNNVWGELFIIPTRNVQSIYQ